MFWCLLQVRLGGPSANTADHGDMPTGKPSFDRVLLLRIFHLIACLDAWRWLSQGLEEGLREALFRRDGRRRTYFCCMENTSLDGRTTGCGKRLLDQNELKAHIQSHVRRQLVPL